MDVHKVAHGFRLGRGVAREARLLVKAVIPEPTVGDARRTARHVVRVVVAVVVTAGVIIMVVVVGMQRRAAGSPAGSLVRELLVVETTEDL